MEGFLNLSFFEAMVLVLLVGGFYQVARILKDIRMWLAKIYEHISQGYTHVKSYKQ